MLEEYFLAYFISSIKYAFLLTGDTEMPYTISYDCKIRVYNDRSKHLVTIDN